MTGELSLAQRLAGLRRDVDEELAACGRSAGSVRILGVSKRQPAAVLPAAVAAGLLDLGENYVQEAAAKRVALDHASGVRLHFIGHVQTNKAKKIVETFDVVQSVDRPDAARALGRAAAAAGRALPVLIQLNVSPTERFGCRPEDAPAVVEAIHSEQALRLDGVMAIGPNSGGADEIRRAFAAAAKTFGIVGGSTLSIGMSGDWREAIRAGSTMIRIGTALFGERPRQ